MKQIVCLSDRPWSAVPTRTQQILARLRDARILYFEPACRETTNGLSHARRVRPNILAYTLPPLPAGEDFYGLPLRPGRKRTAGFICSRLEYHGFERPLLWVAGPGYADIPDYLTFRGLIYDCDRYDPASLEARASALAQAADVVFAASPGLAARLSVFNSNTAVIPNGVNFPMFCRAGLDIPAPLVGISGPVLGWVGDFSPGLDLAPVEYAAREHPGWTFVLAAGGRGNPRLPLLRKLYNVLLPGPCPMGELPDYLGRFDICLHLLQRGSLDGDVVPCRIYEYLSTGKPIVSMLFEDQVEPFPDVVYGAHTMQEFSQLCEKALSEPPDWVSARRRDYGRAASWTARTDQVRSILESIGLY